MKKMYRVQINAPGKMIEVDRDTVVRSPCRILIHENEKDAFILEMTKLNIPESKYNFKLVEIDYDQLNKAQQQSLVRQPSSGVNLSLKGKSK